MEKYSRPERIWHWFMFYKWRIIGIVSLGVAIELNHHPKG